MSATLGVAADRPLDARARAAAIAEPRRRRRAPASGEVFKRATNIAGKAPPGEPPPPPLDAHASERALYDAFSVLRAELRALVARGAYTEAFPRIRVLVPVLHRYFDDVLVMADDAEVRDNRLRLMRSISETCQELARLDLLGSQAAS